MRFKNSLIGMFLVCAFYGSLGCVSAMQHVHTPHTHHEVTTQESEHCHTNQNTLLVLADAKLLVGDSLDIVDDASNVSKPYVIQSKRITPFVAPSILREYAYRDAIPILTVRLLL